MKVAYVLNTPNAANYKVGEMILPQLESDSHGVDVVGIATRAVHHLVDRAKFVVTTHYFFVAQ